MNSVEIWRKMKKKRRKKKRKMMKKRTRVMRRWCERWVPSREGYPCRLPPCPTTRATR